MLKFKSFAAIAIVAALLTQTACKSASFISTLNAVVSAADAAVATLGTAGVINPTQAALITGYLSSVATASATAATELASSDSPAEKTRKITEAFALAILPNLPGLPQTLVPWLKAVNAAVQAFLSNFHQANMQAMTPSVVAAIAPKPSFSDRRKLASIRSHAEKLKAQLANSQKGS